MTIIANKIIGGVFALEDVSIERGIDSIWRHWTRSSKAQYLFHNARSAIRFVVEQQTPKIFWVPAYSCTEVACLSTRLTSQVKFYPVDAQLAPELNFLDDNIEPGDVVLVTNYFGRSCSKKITEFARDRASVIWVEDCAQALDTGVGPVGGVQIFSPRKLVGVPDGGLLVDFLGTITPPNLSSLVSGDLCMKAPQVRSEQLGRARNDLWFPAFKEAERSMSVSLERSHPETKKILSGVKLDKISAARKANYLTLYDELKEFAFFPEEPLSWVPLGFPIIVDDQERLLGYLHSKNIFATCHWSQLVAPKSEFQFEHNLSESLITLPCDQRYSTNDMLRIVAIVKSFYS